MFNPEPDPGSRNYVWEIDSLYMPVNYISSVWGASSDDLWAVGAGGTENDRLLHYDGTSWSTYTNEKIKCAGDALFGFSNDDIWMVGQAAWPDHGAAIWHYDGQKWEQNYLYTIDETFHSMYFKDIWGSSPDNINACGTISFFDGTNECWRGFALHYDGNEWTEIARANFNSQFLRIKNDGEDVFIFSYGLVDGPDIIEYYTIQNDSLQLIHTGNEMGGISDIAGKLYFTIGNNVYLYEDESFNQILSIDYDHFYTKVFGRNEKDIFFLMADGYVHYNGTDMQYIYNLPSADMHFVGEPLIIGDDVYYCMTYPGVNELILHGRLVEE
jgi:hypothetical protein